MSYIISRFCLSAAVLGIAALAFIAFWPIALGTAAIIAFAVVFSAVRGSAHKRR